MCLDDGVGRGVYECVEFGRHEIHGGIEPMVAIKAHQRNLVRFAFMCVSS